MNYNKDFSVIIPHRNSIHFLPKLFSTIPVSEHIEILLVDNSPIPITKEDVGINRHYKLLYSAPERGAGGARNVGIENASGKWLIFADADDYFTEDAFDIFYSKFDSNADLIYTCMGGIYEDTGERSSRGDQYTKLVHGYLANEIPEMTIRVSYASPCCKMIKRTLVENYNIRYDEVVSNNDVYFSLLTGYYASRIDAIDKVTYIATVSKGSLTQRRDIQVIESRFKVCLRYNQFLKQHNISQYQHSVMYSILYSFHFGIKKFLYFIKLLIKYKQNPFIGMRNWIGTYIKIKKQNKKEQQYIVK